MLSTIQLSRRSFPRLLAGSAAAVLAPERWARAGEPAPVLKQAPGPRDERDWQTVRDQFVMPPDLACLNAANLCPSSRPVLDKLFEVTRDVARDPSQNNRRKLSDGKEAARKIIAEFLHAAPDEIVLTRNTSEANNIVSSGIDFKPGDEIVIFSDNHPSNHKAWTDKAARFGFTVKTVGHVNPHPGGEYYLDAFVQASGAKTKLWALTQTGYGDISSQLKLSYFFPRIAHFGVWLARFWTPAVLLLWVGVIYWALRKNRRCVLLAAWAVPFVGFYSFYYHSDRFWWYLRFLLPVMPAVLIGALLVARQLRELAVVRWGSHRAVRPLIAGLLVGVALWAGASSRHWFRFFRVLHLPAREVAYPEGVEWVAWQVPANAAIACFQTSGAVYAYSRFPVIRYDILDRGSAERLAGELAAHETPVFALLFEFEVPGFRERYGDSFVEVGRSGRSSLWRLQQ